MSKMFCMNCHETVEYMMVMAMLSDLGCKGSCERVNECYASENGEHKLVKRENVDRWIVHLNGGKCDFSVYVPKGTPLTDVWEHAKRQYGECRVGSLRKSEVDRVG